MIISHKVSGDKINIIVFLTTSHLFELAGVNVNSVILGMSRPKRAKKAMHSIHKYNKYIKHSCLKSHLLLPTTLLKPKPECAERAISVLGYLLSTPLQH